MKHNSCLSSVKVLVSGKNIAYIYVFLLSFLLLAGPAFAGETSTSTASDALPATGVIQTCGNGPGTPNPASVYCLELGYQLEVVTEKDGGQHSVCIFPDGSSCDAWSFMVGKCGEQYSYCARYGYRQIIKTDGKNPFSPTYPVCVDESKEIGNPLDLMGITERLTRQPLRKIELPPREPSMLREGPEALPRAELPDSFDWRNHNGGNWTTPPKDQNACGSCWAHSAVSATEAAYNLDLVDPDYDLNLAEEYLNSDCLTGDSCCGGWHYNAFGLIKSDGVPDETCLPYDSGFYSSGDCDCFSSSPRSCPIFCPNNGTGICNEKPCSDRCATWANRMVTIADYVKVDQDTEKIKEALIAHGPLSVCFGWRNSSWDANGVLRCDPDAAGDFGHCVTIVGYNDDDGGYYIVKDNYGTTSGDGTGHWRLGYGECNVEEFVYYAVTDDTVNLPPVSRAGDTYEAACSAPGADVQLNGTNSYDPNGDEIDYSWTTTCPGATFDDATSATPILSINGSAAAMCSLDCEVELTVSNDDWPDSTSTATVRIVDTTDPKLSGVPADTTVACDAIPSPAEVTASDSCDPAPNLEFTETRIDGNCPSDYTLIRVWTATDACSNTTSAAQTITVQDLHGPIISSNAPATIVPPDAPIYFTATATDNCDEDSIVEITSYDCYDYTKKGKRIDKTNSCVVTVSGATITILDSGGVSDNIEWTVHAVDNCGNESEETYVIEVINPSQSK